MNVCQCTCHWRYQHVVYVSTGSTIDAVPDSLHEAMRCTVCGHVPGDGTTHYVCENEVGP